MVWKNIFRCKFNGKKMFNCLFMSEECLPVVGSSCQLSKISAGFCSISKCCCGIYRRANGVLFDWAERKDACKQHAARGSIDREQVRILYVRKSPSEYLLAYFQKLWKSSRFSSSSVFHTGYINLYFFEKGYWQGRAINRGQIRILPVRKSPLQHLNCCCCLFPEIVGEFEIFTLLSSVLLCFETGTKQGWQFQFRWYLNLKTHSAKKTTN